MQETITPLIPLATGECKYEAILFTLAFKYNPLLICMNKDWHKNTNASTVNFLHVKRAECDLVYQANIQA